jgi:hypothetical protein
MKQYISNTKNGKKVYVDMTGSHAATHIGDTPGLLELVNEALTKIDAVDENIYLDMDMGREIGLSDLVETSEADEIVYAKRFNRTNYTRFVKNHSAQPTQYLALVLQKDGDVYELKSTWIGRITPQFPGDELETPDSRSFWQAHALAWGNQAVQEGTEVTEWPW